MATVSFTGNLTRHVTCPPVDLRGDTVRTLSAQIFEQNPRLKSYVVDEQFALRKHMGIFIDGEIIKDRKGLTDSVESNSEVFVLHALSGS